MASLDPVNRLYNLVKNKSTVPRWIIFSLDICICAFALFFAYLLRFNMDFNAVNKHGYIIQIFLVSGMNLIFFRLFRTYEGIIRLSSAKEGLRCVSAVFFSSFFLLISVAVSAVFKLPYLVPTSVLIIYFFTASFLIFAYRIGIRELYHRSLKAKFIAENVLIFGTTESGAFLKKAIESIAGCHYKVIGFIEINENLWGKSIDNAKIYSLQQIKTIVPKSNLKFLFMASDEIGVEMKNDIVDYCLAENIGIKVIPSVREWVDGQLRIKEIKNLKIEDLLNRPSIKLEGEHVQKYLNGKRILVTGAAGSIGSGIVKQLAAIDAELLILCDNNETGLYELQYQLQQLTGNDDNIIVCPSDVRNKNVMMHVFETYKPHVVFHAAAYKHVPLMEMHPCEAIKNNVLGTKIMADLSVRYGVERFVFISTDKAINPANVMGASKRIAEMYVAELQVNQRHIEKSRKGNFDPENLEDIFFGNDNTTFITTRFGNVLGSNGSVIPRFQTQIDKGGPVTVTHPEIIRYFMTIPEACSLVLEAGSMGRGGEIFVFDMGEPVKIVDLAHKMIRLAGLTPGKDINVEFTGLRPGEKLYEEVIHRNEEVMPTHHKKIMIARANNNGMETISGNVDYLIELADNNKNMLVVKQMKVIVSEYKSKNSTYEKLDIAENPGFISLTA